MKVLAIETSTLIGSVAILDNDRPLAEYTIRIRDTHSERLLTSIERMLFDSDLKIDDIDCIAVAIGPGSFTGLRIGLSTAKGLAYSVHKPIAAVSTLQALAMNVYSSKYLVCPILDARKKEVYTSLYKFNDNLEMTSIIDECAIAPSRLCDTIHEKTIFLGDGVDVYSNLMSDMLGELALFAPTSLRYPKASNVARLAQRPIAENKLADLDVLTPNYLRLSEAELKRK